MGPAIVTIKCQETLIIYGIIGRNLTKVAQIVRFYLYQGIVHADEVLERAIDNLKLGRADILGAHRVEGVQIEKYLVPLREVFVHSAVLKEVYMSRISRALMRYRCRCVLWWEASIVYFVRRQIITLVKVSLTCVFKVNYFICAVQELRLVHFRHPYVINN